MPFADLEEGLAALADAEEDYELAELYYEGKNPEHFASVLMRRALRAYEAKYRLRLAKVPVDAIAERLEIATVSVSASEGEDERLTQTLQDDVRDANDMEVMEPKVMFKACEYGDSYLIVDHDPDENVVTLYYNNPYECRVFYDRSGRYKRFAIKVWWDVDETGAEYGRATLFYANGVEEYITKPGTDGNDIYDWITWGDGSTQVDANGEVIMVPAPPGTVDEDNNPVDEIELVQPGVYGWFFGQVPVFHFRTDDPYGKPEHEAAYGPQDMMDKLTITHMSTVDTQAFPQRFFLEDPNFDMEDQGETWDEDDADVNTTSESTPNLQAGPGIAWFLKGIKSAGQFDVADSEAFLKPLMFLGKAMASVTNTPIPLFDDDSTTSGEDRRVKESGQTRRVKKRQKQFGATWREVYAYCLSLLTGKDFDDLRERIDIGWVPAESIDPAEAWELAGKKKGIGLPLVQILAEHGYSPDQIEEIAKLGMEERREMLELQREQFQASMQERRADRPSRPNPDQPQSAEQQGGTT